MIPRIISTKKIHNWLDQLSTDYPLIAPKYSEELDDYEYEEITDVKTISLDFDRTKYSLKQIFLKPEEKLFTASYSKGNPKAVKPDNEKRIVFAARPCDITALNLLDQVFGRDPYPDPYYLAQRERTLIIGLRCLEKCRNCFCGTMDSYNPLEGYDIMLTKLPTDDYIIECHTPKGKELIRETENKKPDLLREASNKDRSVMLTTFKAIESTFTPHVPTLGLRTLMDFSQAQDIWKKYGEICLSCGSCVFSCPTCWCFDVKDKVAADENDPGNVDATVRQRRWTACLYREYHSVSGGHVFKPHVSSRIENYYKHKIQGVHEKFGVWGCVGCGRCVSACPVGIDVRESLEELTGVSGGLKDA